MELSIRELLDHERRVWKVNACGCEFSFSDRASAEAFAIKLKERAEAPHGLPEDVLRRWAEEHERMLRDP